MISLFRKIRQKLLKENRITQYLAYAIGEIFLVVIGILIALQINTWNQQRIENDEELEILFGLKEEFENNLEEINFSIIINSKVTEDCLQLTQLIRSNSIENNPELVDELLVRVGTFNSFDAQTGVASEIVNSGKLNLLRNDALRTQIVNWLTLLVDQEEDILFRSDNYTMNLMPFLMERFPLANGELTKKLPYDKKDYLKTYPEKSPFKTQLVEADYLEFENQIWHHKHNNDYVSVNELNIKDFINITLKMIEGELNRKK
ncbi:DUF6090 family protein [Algoriphagus sediminis]|uniref:DUF6090 family protein n=1 Tax=Algoriphagus sediminis TaxID=3057113 RepID=A0ABT7YCB4_9BACT|nr:DUF6090 family protein [Algoriphagus sediminis]MDN3204118.1 DUF6090 family protein [Algoriphagus sediminis]